MAAQAKNKLMERQEKLEVIFYNIPMELNKHNMFEI